MLSKSAQEFLAEANAAIETMTVEDARRLHGKSDVVFIDVREGSEYAQGHIPGAVHAARGFLEFVADPASPMHKPELVSGKRLVLYCGSGGRSALAAKTLTDMGLKNLCHVAGGFGAWAKAGGPVEK